MGQHYLQISFAERRRIQDLRDVKVPVSAIAEELGRHRSTIHREIRRNFYHDPFRDRWGKEYKSYYCTSAQKYAQDRRARRRLKLTLNPRLRDHVIAKLGEGWSPQQIAGRLKHDALPLGTVSHETIYRFIHGPKALTMDSYFCDPHSPWQKGGVENANGRVRRDPTSNRAKCGTTSPTQPITPEKEATVASTSATTAKINQRSRSNRTPNMRALSSPSESRLMRKGMPQMTSAPPGRICAATMRSAVPGATEKRPAHSATTIIATIIATSAANSQERLVAAAWAVATPRESAADDAVIIQRPLIDLGQQQMVDLRLGRLPAIDQRDAPSDHAPQDRSPRLVLADFRLKGEETGSEAIRRLGQRFGVALPGILMTGDTSLTRTREASDSGYRLLHKPLGPQALLSAMRDILTASRIDAEPGYRQEP